MKAPGERLYGHNYLCQVLTLSLSQAKGPLQDFNTIHWNFDIYQEKVKTFKEIGFH